MSLQVDVQIASDDDDLPSVNDVIVWARAAVGRFQPDAELTVRIVDEAEGTALNRSYRNTPEPTNVLSFPFERPPGVSLALLGDIVICAAVVKREACEQKKPADAHWAHMVVHGALHLLGFDHQAVEEADRMESLEREILSGLGYHDPYSPVGAP